MSKCIKKWWHQGKVNMAFGGLIICNIVPLKYSEYKLLLLIIYKWLEPQQYDSPSPDSGHWSQSSPQALPMFMPQQQSLRDSLIDNSL